MNAAILVTELRGSPSFSVLSGKWQSWVSLINENRDEFLPNKCRALGKTGWSGGNANNKRGPWPCFPHLKRREKLPSLSPSTGNVRPMWGNIGGERDLQSGDTLYIKVSINLVDLYGRNSLLLALCVPRTPLNPNLSNYFSLISARADTAGVHGEQGGSPHSRTPIFWENASFATSDFPPARKTEL